jgi:hypothetical protein
MPIPRKTTLADPARLDSSEEATVQVVLAEVEWPLTINPTEKKPVPRPVERPERLKAEARILSAKNRRLLEGFDRGRARGPKLAVAYRTSKAALSRRAGSSAVGRSTMTRPPRVVRRSARSGSRV